MPGEAHEAGEAAERERSASRHGADGGAKRSIITQPTWTYLVVRTTTRWFFRVFFRVRFEATDQLPPEGGVLLAINHQSFLDIPLVAMSTQRHVSFVARHTLAGFGPLTRPAGQA